MYNLIKGQNTLISFLASMLWLSMTLAVPCLAIPSQVPLGVNLAKELRWEDCGQLNNHTVECSRLDVPMDHSKASSDKTFSIPLIRMLGKSASITGEKHILVNPGGPGGSGVGFLWRAGGPLNMIIGEDFHLLSFDPRGVNGSIPQATCYPTEQQRADSFTSNPWDLDFEAGEMYTRAENKAKACEDTMGEYAGYINTPQTAADMDSILDAIGQEKMYYWGFSYGTTLGQTYAQMFPNRVSRLIIDGVSNLDEWYNSFGFDESLIDADRIFTGFIEECFKSEQSCPLKSIGNKTFESSGDLKSYIDDFLENLDLEPIPVYINNTNYGAVTRRSLVTNGIFRVLYSPIPGWLLLANNLAELLSGNATSTFQAYSDSWIAGILRDETNTFVVKNDNLKTGPAAPAHGIKPLQNYSFFAPEMSSLVSRYQGSDNFDTASWSIPTTHKFQPKYHPEFPRVKTAEPILVLSTTWDPVCPLISAKKAHNSFEGAGFVEQKSYGHCSISMPSLCTMKHVKRYFSEGVLPEAGSTCNIDIPYFPTPHISSISAVAQEDQELLAALHDLATEDVISSLVSGRYFGF